MKQLLFFSSLLLSIAGFSQATKSMRDYTLRTPQLGDTTFTNRGTTGTSTFLQLKGLYFAGTTLQYTRGDGSLATFPTSNTAFTNSAGYTTAANFIVGEVPAGTKNGTNAVFTIANTPTTNKEIVYVNGIRQKRGTDYTITGATITLSIAPRSTDDLLTDYIF